MISRQIDEVRLRVGAYFDEFKKGCLGCLQFRIGQAPAKQLVPQPNPIGVDDIRFTVVGHFLNPAIKAIACNFTTMHAVWLSNCIPMTLQISLSVAFA
jgi:hypothetical protein